MVARRRRTPRELCSALALRTSDGHWGLDFEGRSAQPSPLNCVMVNRSGVLRPARGRDGDRLRCSRWAAAALSICVCHVPKHLSFLNLSSPSFLNLWSPSFLSVSSSFQVQLDPTPKCVQKQLRVDDRFILAFCLGMDHTEEAHVSGPGI
jgi:hypothetical protein